MSTAINRLPKESTLEGLIEKLDQRGLLVFQVLLGQQAMSLLSKDYADKPKSNILVPSI